MSNAPKIIPRDKHTISRDDISEAALKVLYRLKKQGYLPYLCGGGVRDLLLERKPKDFDLVTDATPNQIRRVFRNCRIIGRRFRLAHIYFQDEIIEVATFRSLDTDTPDPKGKRRETVVVRDDGFLARDNRFGTPEEDARRRDFTINALFYDVSTFAIIDYVDGLRDLNRKTVRLIGDPLVRYQEDPVRMIRAIRFASMLGFKIERKTYKGILQCRELLASASNARMFEEVQKLFLCGAAEAVSTALFKTGLFHICLPPYVQWVEKNGRKARHTHNAAMRWLDARKLTGDNISPALMFALILGDWIMSHAEHLMQDEHIPWTPAVNAASQAAFQDLSQHVLIPKAVGYQVRHILESQKRFDSTRGKRPHRFVERQFFLDALEYYDFTCTQNQGDPDLLMWWRSFYKKQEPRLQAASSNEEEDSRKSGRGQRRRRSGRNRRGRSRKRSRKPEE